MFSSNQSRNNHQSKAKGAQTSERTHYKAMWCIGILFACGLLLAVASPWTVTGSNGKQKQSARPQVAGSSSEGQSAVSPLGSYLGNQDLTKTLWDAGMNAPAAPRPQSRDGVWQTIDSSSVAAADWQAPPADSYQVLRLNKDALAQQLARAPMERTGDLRESPAVLSLPMPDGSFQRFHIEESPVMDAELVARYPEIKSYRGQGIEDGAATVRFDWTPLGFHALVLSPDHAVNILPPHQADITTYASYYDQGEAFECSVTDQQQTMKAGPVGRVRTEVAVGTQLRTYRLAVAATNEFCVLVGGNTVAGSTAAINTFLTGINAIWERELSSHMNLVAAPNVIYAGDNVTCGGACTGANDPYTNGTTSTMLNEVRPDLDTKVLPANYDIGHVLGTNSGGIAFVSVVCRDTLCNAQPGACKGGGASGMTAPAGNSGSVGLWAHELGHQFGGNHTHNAITGSCGPGNGPNDNRDGAAAVEPGSGTTILSYVGICAATDNISNTRDLRWHAGTFAEISTFLAGAGAGCAVTTATGNNIPTVNAGTARTIPRQTPFTLTATGSDADAGDIPNLTFIWEQVDAAGGTDCTLAGNLCNPPYGDQAGDGVGTTRPLFRVFSPVKGTSRTFPSLTYILNNANVPPATVGGFRTAEDLPSVSRTMNFRATVRDNRAGFGGVNDSSVAITVDGASGPFAVTAPNGGGTLSGAQTVTWSVNNTNAAPVSTANVKITLSTDGGNTFPIVLNASTANDGTEAVTLPNGITSSTARVKVEAVGNIFFDISDANFTLVPADTCPAVSDFSPKVGNIGSAVTITGVNFTNGGNVTGVKFTNNVAAVFTVVNNTTITTNVPAGAVGGPITLSKGGCGDLLTAGYNVCPNPPVALTIDDGGVETASSSGTGAYYVNRLTPGAYPATLNQISIFWDPFQLFPAGTVINVVAGINAGGGANIDGTAFQTFAATAGAQPGFTTYTLPIPIKITAGDFVVGFQDPTNPAGSFAIAIDTNGPVSRSYRSTNGGTTFTNVTTGNYMIRAAQVFTGICTGPTATNGSIGGTITDGDGAPISGAAINLSGTELREAITDSAGRYSFDSVETNGFYTVTPSRANYTFSPANRSFSLLGVHTEASFTATMNSGGHVNAIDTTEFFVRQHYLDFLGREPDAPGFAGWVTTINNCVANDPSCDRVHVSESFFRSQEFQERGYFAYRFYATALGRKPDYAEFTPDLARVSGFLTNDQLEAAKTALIDDFMSRPAFAGRYNSLGNAAYVDQLMNTAGVNVANRQSLINALNARTQTRAGVLRQIAESGEVYQRYYNQAFVVMEYFGYLHRDPDAMYTNWIAELDRSGSARRMVDGFVNSTEYRNRFAQ